MEFYILISIKMNESIFLNIYDKLNHHTLRTINIIHFVMSTCMVNMISKEILKKWCYDTFLVFFKEFGFIVQKVNLTRCHLFSNVLFTQFCSFAFEDSFFGLLYFAWTQKCKMLIQHYHQVNWLLVGSGFWEGIIIFQYWNIDHGKNSKN